MGGFLSSLGQAFGQSGQNSSPFSGWSQPTGMGMGAFNPNPTPTLPWQSSSFMQPQQQAQPAGPSGLYALLQMIGALR